MTRILALCPLALAVAAACGSTVEPTPDGGASGGGGASSSSSASSSSVVSATSSSSGSPVGCLPNTNICDDKNPCTADSCVGAEQCVFTPLDGVKLPPPLQTPGDCHVLVCDMGTPQTLVDNTDIQDDGNPCTDDLCQNGISIHSLKPVGSPCAPGAICTQTGTCGLMSGQPCTKNEQCASNLCLPNMTCQ